MANINMYDREKITPGNQNPTPEVILNPELEEKKKELPSLLVPVLFLATTFFTWDFLT